jgi:hypothetical protein
MSREQDSAHPDDSFEKKLAKLRNELEKSGDLIPGIDRLLKDLSLIGQEGSVLDEGGDMLSVLVSEALRGVDIGVRYPHYYKMLLLDDEFRQDFLDALDILTGEPEAEKEPEMEASYPDLSFLREQNTSHVLERINAKRWRAVWRQDAEQLQRLFFENQRDQFVYRIAENYLEENWMPMIRDEIEVNGIRYGVYLEVSTLDIMPESLELSLAIMQTSSVLDSEAISTKLQAKVAWGDYKETVIFSDESRVTFPPLLLSLILDESGQKISSDLQLTLESI